MNSGQEVLSSYSMAGFIEQNRDKLVLGFLAFEESFEDADLQCVNEVVARFVRFVEVVHFGTV